MARGKKSRNAKQKAKQAEKKRATTKALGIEGKSKGKPWKKGPAGA